MILTAFMKGNQRLDEAAYIDGASYWQAFWHGSALARPALLTVNVFNYAVL